MQSLPTLEQVVTLVRQSAGIDPATPVRGSARLQSDLGIWGDDVTHLLLDAENQFSVRFPTNSEESRELFSLKQGERVFKDEVHLLTPLFALFRLLSAKSGDVRDLTVSELHAAICRLTALAPRPNKLLERTREG